MRSLAALEPRILVRGRPTLGGRARYVEYARHLLGSADPAPGSVAALERPYRDFLQAPLQPLGDDLEAATYETFERDPVKYARYEAAAALFLGDFRARSAPGARALFAVVGAGRGPLVAAVLRAAAAARVAVGVYAVEKNAHAVCTLRGRLCGNQIFNPTSMCAELDGLRHTLRLCFGNSMRAIDSSKNQPNRLRIDRAREF